MLEYEHPGIDISKSYLQFAGFEWQCPPTSTKDQTTVPLLQDSKNNFETLPKYRLSVAL